MNSIERRKLEQINAMDTEALQRIIDSAGNSDVKRSWDAPLAGQVTIEGIGMVPVNLLRNVVASR